MHGNRHRLTDRVRHGLADRIRNGHADGDRDVAVALDDGLLVAPGPVMVVAASGRRRVDVDGDDINGLRVRLREAWWWRRREAWQAGLGLGRADDDGFGLDDAGRW